MVPRGGLPENSNIKSLSCPTLASRSIEFQGVFSRLSHCFDDPNRAAHLQIGISRTEAPSPARIRRTAPSEHHERPTRRSHLVPDADGAVRHLPSPQSAPACLFNVCPG